MAGWLCDALLPRIKCPPAMRWVQVVVYGCAAIWFRPVVSRSRLWSDLESSISQRCGNDESYFKSYLLRIIIRKVFPEISFYVFELWSDRSSHLIQRKDVRFQMKPPAEKERNCLAIRKGQWRRLLIRGPVTSWPNAGYSK